jgi:hypothetical protein
MIGDKVKIVLTLWLIILILSGCTIQGENPGKPIEERLSISMDPRIELLGTIKILSDFKASSNNCALLNTVYKMNVVRYFEPFKDDQAVIFYEELSKSPLKDSLLLNLMLHLSNPPNLEVEIPLSDLQLIEGISYEDLDQFITKLREFSNKSNFNNFINSQKELIDQFVSIQKNAVLNNVEDMLKIEGYFGKEQNSYNVIITPLILYERYIYFFQNDLGDNNEKIDIYLIAGISKVINGYPSFGEEDEYREIIYSKVTHYFVDPVTEKYNKEISKYSYLFDPITKSMEKQNILSWNECVNEHIVKAIELELNELTNDTVKDKLNQIESDGFIYIRRIYKTIKRYNLNRDKFKTFEDFYPEIIKSFEGV